MTLTAFLLARIAEDEAVARATLDGFDPLDWGDSTEDFDAWRMQGPVDGPSGYSSLIVDPQRVLAECKAKWRLVVTEHRLWNGSTAIHSAEDECLTCEAELWPCTTLRVLALPYADHPDYDEAWRP